MLARVLSAGRKGVEFGDVHVRTDPPGLAT